MLTKVSVAEYTRFVAHAMTNAGEVLAITERIMGGRERLLPKAQLPVEEMCSCPNH